MEKLFEIKTKYTQEEHLKFNYAVMKNNKSTWIVMALVVLMLIFGIIAKMMYIVIFAILYPFIFIALVHYKAKKIYQSNKASHDAEITIEFYEDYLIQKMDVGSYKVEHDKIDKVIETKTHFYIMISENQGVFVPKANLPEGLEEYIRKLMETKK